MPLVLLDRVSKTFDIGRKGGRSIKAVDSVSLSIDSGQTLGLIGESGSGKSTVGRLVLRLLEPDSGNIYFAGRDITNLEAKRIRPIRSDMQVVFQEPFESLNPRMRIQDIIAEPLDIHESSLTSEARERRVLEALEQVGLDSDLRRRRPGELSGGQQQRIGIARAIVTRPSLIVLDEPTSSLDLSVQAQILQLLAELQSELDLTYLYISHDISTIRFFSHAVAVMYLGHIVESGPTETIFADPRHPYTRALLSSRLSPDPDNPPLSTLLVGDIEGSQSVTGEGCVFYPRCPVREQVCAVGPIDVLLVGPTHHAACIKADRRAKIVDG